MGKSSSIQFDVSFAAVSAQCCGVKVLFPLEDGEQHTFSLPYLKTLQLEYLPQLEAPRLQKLKEIFVYDNSELEEVFGDKDVADVMDHKEIVVPQLKRLDLGQLPRCPKMSTRFSMGEDRCVHAKAKALTMGKQHEIAEFPSEPSIDIECYNFDEIQKRLPRYIEKDEQSIEQEEEEI
ncbi:hypothetical protein Patl1_04195 [Pistacia atlantica]|uniref:Uncharacterized protein n=1 Tax=Pistacia atlantica TaxID=434234 RepID=A0ACC1BSE6_9ROSI|nr:hypothetical protein Patl1_04195 [Pistacia atlantica]